MKRKWWIVGGLVFLELLVCAGIVALGWTGRAAFEGVRFFYVADTHIEETIEKAFTVDGPAILDVEVSSDDVTVTGGAEDEVEVVARLSLWGADEKDARQQLDVKMTQEGDRIVIRVERLRRIYAFTVNRGSYVDFEIRVPAGTLLQVKTSSGDLAVRDVTGSADLQTTSGSLKAERFDGAVRAHASSGDIVMSHLNNGSDMIAESTSGRISLDGVAGDSLVVQTSSGDVTLTGVSAAEDFKVDASSGDINLRNVEAGNLTVSAISGDPELTNLSVTGGVGIETSSGSVVVQDFEAGSLTVDASSGQIQIERGTLGKGLVVENTSSFIAVTGVGASSYRLTSSSGNISLKGCGGPVYVETTSGRIDIENATAVQLAIETSSGGLNFFGSLAAEGSNSIRSISGDVRLVLPGDAAFDLDVETTSGDIDTDFTVGMTEFGEDHVAGKVNGGGPALQIRTSSGDITLQSRN